MSVSKLAMATVMSSLLLAGCVTSQSGGGIGDSCGSLGWGSIIGGVGGAVGGGYLGSRWSGAGRSTQNAATIAGTLLGALGGAAMGSRFDSVDCMRANQARTQALSSPVGVPVQWGNPNTNNSGMFVTRREGYTQQGQYCREYTQQIIIGGQRQEGVGMACRNPDGSWQIQQ